MALRPSKWIKYAPVAALPLLAAWALNTNSMQQDVLSRSAEGLKAAGAEWAKVALDGRDATLSGDSLTQASIDAAVKSVAGTYGVRRVEVRAKVLPLLPPSANAIKTDNPPLVVTGTWQEGVARGLRVSLLGEVWELGKNQELASDGKGNWTLTFPLLPEPGTYDILVEVLDSAGRATADTTKNEIVVLPKLAAPTVTSVETNQNPPEIRGTWPSGIATAMTVAVGAAKYLLGQAKELTTEGDNWLLVPPESLAEGPVDVTVKVSDATGRTTRTAEPGKITIDTIPPPQPVIGPIKVDGESVTASGTFDEAGTATFTAKIADRTWVYRADPALKSDGSGNWTFTPDMKLAPGTYDLELELRDKAGNIARDSTRDEIVIPELPAPPAQMLAPTVASAEELVARPVVNGTWSEVAAKSLVVTLAGKTYTFGSSDGLKSDGVGNWALTPDKPLADGTYDVAAETRDAGNRSLTDTTSNELVIDAQGPATPGVSLYAGEASPLAITGAWDSTNATSLSVAVPAAGIATTLAAGTGLTASGDSWSLALPAPLQPGVYDVSVETADGRGRMARDQTKFEINVKEPPPPPEPEPVPQPVPEPAPAEMTPPTINTYGGELSPESISGTWDNVNAAELEVAIPGANITARLEPQSPLVTSPDGKWLLALSQKLKPGIYNVVVRQSAKGGRVSTDNTTAEIYIKEPPPPPPPPYDCEGVLAKISAVFPIRFAFGVSQLAAPYDLAVNQYASLLTDPRCIEVKAQVTGHADYYGGRLYNRALSVARAQGVAGLLASAGVNPARLAVDGLGKAMPLDSERKREARARNRRVEITIVK